MIESSYITSNGDNSLIAVGAALEKGDYPKVAQLIASEENTDYCSGEFTLSPQLKSARELCSKCIEQRRLTEQYRQASQQASNQEQVLQQELIALLRSIEHRSNEPRSVEQTRVVTDENTQVLPAADSTQPPDSNPITGTKRNNSNNLWRRFRQLLFLPWHWMRSATVGLPTMQLPPETDVSDAGSDVALIDDQANKSAASLVVYCLGKFQVVDCGRLISEWPNSKSKQVFKYLLTHRQHSVSKDSLMETFWPEVDPDHARNSLNVAIYRIRHTLSAAKPFSNILFKDGCYMINPKLKIWIDAEAFVEHLKKGRQFEKQGNQAAAISEYHAAVPLYGGEFLEEERYESWTETHRRNLESSYIQLLEKLYRHYFDKADYDNCISYCNKLLEVDACQEEVHCQIMRCYSRQKRLNLAIRQFHRCTRVLKRDFDTVPGTKTVEIYRRIRQYKLV